jgi:hypothetical protein
LRELTWIDKTKWGNGPWQSEPDKVQWTDSATGLSCLALRNEHLGNWCGYVGVPEGHPLYHVAYSECPQHCEASWCEHVPEGRFEVHGGLTYSAGCDEADPEHGICHVPEPGQPDAVWWFGFDCAHCFDLSPYMAAREAAQGWPVIDRAVYRDLNYVRGQCGDLARQLAETPA